MSLGSLLGLSIALPEGWLSHVQVATQMAFVRIFGVHGPVVRSERWTQRDGCVGHVAISCLRSKLCTH